MILPEPNKVFLHYNSTCERWEVHKGCIVLTWGTKAWCRSYCSVNGYELTDVHKFSDAGRISA